MPHKPSGRDTRKPVGTIGDFGCFSAHPLKNLNAIGDGGYITANDPDAGEELRRLRSHGMENRETCFEFGYVSRMDAIQAAVLDYRLGRLDGIMGTTPSKTLRLTNSH